MIDGSTLNVLDLLPHRDPLSGLRALLRLNQVNRLLLNSMLIQNLPLFRGHFPGQSFCQASLLWRRFAQAAPCRFAGLKKVRQGALVIWRALIKQSFAHRLSQGTPSGLKRNDKEIFPYVHCGSSRFKGR